MTNAKNLRNIFEQNDMVIAPGAFDAFSCMLIQEIGFKVAYMGGFSISASKIGYPDWGFATMNEMLNSTSHAVNVLDIPVIADIDQGFGSLTNFARTVHEYENAGVAAIHFEDQPFPKKCSQQKDREVIPLDIAVKKIRAAIETRNDPDFMLIARTDSKDIEGIDGLKRRMDKYLNAGADYVIFCEQTSEKELYEVGNEFPSRVIAFAGDNPDNEAWCLSVSDYEEMNYKGLIYPALGLTSAYQQMKKNYNKLFQTRYLEASYIKSNMGTLEDVQELTQMSKWQSLRDRYDLL